MMSLGQVASTAYAYSVAPVVRAVQNNPKTTAALLSAAALTSAVAVAYYRGSFDGVFDLQTCTSKVIETKETQKYLWDLLQFEKIASKTVEECTPTSLGSFLTTARSTAASVYSFVLKHPVSASVATALVGVNAVRVAHILRAPKAETEEQFHDVTEESQTVPVNTTARRQSLRATTD